MVRKPGKRLGRERWAGLVAKFERSGLCHAEFCRRERVALGTFQSWLYRLRAEGAGAVPSFVELEARRAVGFGCRVRVGAVEVEFAEAPDASYLSALVTSLGHGAR